MSVGDTLLTTTANHLATYNETTDEFLLLKRQAILSCKIVFDINNNIINCNTEHVVHDHNESALLRSLDHGNGTLDQVVITSTDFLKIANTKLSKYSLKIKIFPVLGCYSFKSIVVTITSCNLTTNNLYNSEHHTIEIDPLKKCTSIVATSRADPTSWHDIEVLYCDGNKIFHYLDNKVSHVDTGKVLSFCRCRDGFLAAFETNWRLSPLHLFGEGPINIENLEIPRTKTSSNEARLQIYGFESLEVLDEKTLPSHNEPTMLVEHCGVVCVSGFYKHSIAIFTVRNGVLKHIRDISVGFHYRCAGLSFRYGELLVLKRKFDSDDILLTFPSNTGTVMGDTSLDLVKISEYVEKLDTSSYLDYPYPEFLRNRITKEQIDKKAQEILLEYKTRPKDWEGFSDSEISEETLEQLASYQRIHPFIPIPVSDSSEDDDHSILQFPGQLILPKPISSINTNLIEEVVQNAASNNFKILSELPDPGKESFNNQNTQKIENKLDKIITLLEKQNMLLEMLARQSLVEKTARINTNNDEH